ncbi:Uncharacterized protein DBV15_02708 [Temnothorax longispinosus]|uniref:Uncharacterized protein n=1 Tax=Temnothorax longispinosus TaxID=300112 RepID=A0A4S2K965_9HYME|nr:Uncharacterized protein DBV15_02708 [Temnothorax longispinosus]
MARYRTRNLPMNNEILSCAENRDTSENARGNKSATTIAKGLLFRFCRGNAERTTLTTLEGCPDRVDESLPCGVSGGGLRSPIEDDGAAGDGLKHAHRAGKRAPLAKKSGRRPSSPRTILSGEGIEARKKPREGPFSRQTEPFSSEKITGGLDVEFSRLLRPRGSARGPCRINPATGALWIV